VVWRSASRLVDTVGKNQTHSWLSVLSYVCCSGLLPGSTKYNSISRIALQPATGAMAVAALYKATLETSVLIGPTMTLLNGLV